MAVLNRFGRGVHRESSKGIAPTSGFQGHVLIENDDEDIYFSDHYDDMDDIYADDNYLHEPMFIDPEIAVAFQIPIRAVDDAYIPPPKWSHESPYYRLKSKDADYYRGRPLEYWQLVWDTIKSEERKDRLRLKRAKKYRDYLAKERERLSKIRCINCINVGHIRKIWNNQLECYACGDQWTDE